MSKTTIVQDVLDVFRAAGFEVRVSEFGDKPETIIYGTSDNAGILMESVCEHFSSTEAGFSCAQREDKGSKEKIDDLLTEVEQDYRYSETVDFSSLRAKVSEILDAPLTAPAPLTDQVVQVLREIIDVADEEPECVTESMWKLIVDAKVVLQGGTFQAKQDISAELLARLEWAVRFIDTYASKAAGPTTPEVNKCRAAIAKAKGGAA